MIDPSHPTISIRDQCSLAGISRASYYFKSKVKFIQSYDEMVALMLKIHENHPYFGRPRLHIYLLKSGFKVTAHRVGKMMKEHNIKAVTPFRKLTKSRKEHKKYPYLLKDLKVSRSNQVWATDITYLRLNGGYVYLTAIIDLYSRKILSWEISNTQDTSLCLRVLVKALSKYGKPKIFNTDQGSQYTSKAFTALLKSNEISISMDGVGRAIDNIFIERFWRTVKYEEFFLNEYSSLKELRVGIGNYMNFYNSGRYHQSLYYKVPDEIYYNDPATMWVKRRVVIPNISWVNSPNSLEKFTFEKCVYIFKNNISKEDHLKAA
jgi:putative transposase